MGKYVEIDHPADLALRVFSQNLPELFTSALEGMYSLIFENEYFISEEISNGMIEISFETNNLEELLVDWLSEMLFKFDVNNEIVTACKIIKIQKEGETSFLRANISLKKIKLLEVKQTSEIKAVTYHKLKIESDNNGYSTIIVFDV